MEITVNTNPKVILEFDQDETELLAEILRDWTAFAENCGERSKLVDDILGELADNGF